MKRTESQTKSQYYEIRSALQWLMFSRLLVSICGICAIALLQHFTKQTQLTKFAPAHIILIFAAMLNLVYLILLHINRNFTIQGFIQLTVDVLIISALIYFTGGIDSIFVILYFLNIFAWAVIISKDASILSASFSTIILAIICFIYSYCGRNKIPMPIFDITFPILEVKPTEAVEITGLKTDIMFLFTYLTFFAMTSHLIAHLSGSYLKELRRVKLLNDEILNNIPSAVLAVNTQGEIIFVNDSASKLLNLEGNPELKKFDCVEICKRNGLGEVAEALIELKELEGEFSIQDKEIEKRLSFITIPLKSVVGEYRGAIAIINDISFLNEIEQTTKQLERTQAIAQMTATITHEIRNPLTSIKGAVQELIEKSKSNLTDLNLLNILARESDRLNRIVSDFLEFSKEKRLQKVKVSINSVLGEITTLLQKDSLASNSHIILSAKENLEVEADVEQIKQVFYNVIMNSLQSIKSNGRIEINCFKASEKFVEASSSVKTSIYKPGVKVEIKDNGEGMDEETLKRIGTPFFTTKPRGTGLGLAVAIKIVNSHNGRIEFFSKKGLGTTVHIWLPT